MFARRIAVVGTGYVGLTTGACLASLGHQVTCVDVDEIKVARLSAGQVDILEPGLEELVSRTDVPVVANPEFLREGTAVADFLNPDRIVVGADDEPAARWVAELYR